MPPKGAMGGSTSAKSPASTSTAKAAGSKSGIGSNPKSSSGMKSGPGSTGGPKTASRSSGGGMKSGPGSTGGPKSSISGKGSLGTIKSKSPTVNRSGPGGTGGPKTPNSKGNLPGTRSNFQKFTDKYGDKKSGLKVKSLSPPIVPGVRGALKGVGKLNDITKMARRALDPWTGPALKRKAGIEAAGAIRGYKSNGVPGSLAPSEKAMTSMSANTKMKNTLNRPGAMERISKTADKYADKIGYVGGAAGGIARASQSITDSRNKTRKGGGGGGAGW